LRITGELADLAERSGRDAYAVLDNARRALRRVAGRAKGRLRRAIDELTTTVERSRRILAETANGLPAPSPTPRPGW
jgi:transposase, IS5 family